MLIDWLTRKVQARLDMDSPGLKEYIRSGGRTHTQALEMAAVLRCIDLLSNSLAMLPFVVRRRENDEIVEDHTVHELLTVQPNNWQTPYEFMQLMEYWRRQYGSAYAYIVRSGNRPIQLQPLDPRHVKVSQNSDWSLEYQFTRADNETRIVPQDDILHVRDVPNGNGYDGSSRVDLAQRAIDLARDAEIAQSNLFKNGVFAGGTLEHPDKLSKDAQDRLKTAFEEKYASPENAGKWMVLEEGLTAKAFSMTAQEAQTVEARNFQLEDIARIFGVPRPLLMMDDTSWGSGIEQLAILFVQFGLAPSMTAWEQAATRSLFTRLDRKRYYCDIDERRLLRGSLQDQAEFFSKALGSGGHPQFMADSEVRQSLKLGPWPEGNPNEQRQDVEAIDA